MPTGGGRTRSGRLAPILESEPELLWLLPALASVFPIVVGVMLARLSPTTTSSPLLLDTSADGYRSVLMGLLTALLTALSVMLPVTLVASSFPGGPADLESLVVPVRDARIVGFERTLPQDISFDIRQIVDLAIEATSPCVNDPYLAGQGLDDLERLLVQLAPCRLGHQMLHDDPDGRHRQDGHGKGRHSHDRAAPTDRPAALHRTAPHRTGDDHRHGRLLAAPPSNDFDNHLRLATDQIIRFGEHEPSVLSRLLRLVRTIPGAAHGLHTQALHDRVDAVRDAARSWAMSPDTAPADVEAVAAEARSWIDDDLAPRFEPGPSLF